MKSRKVIKAIKAKQGHGSYSVVTEKDGVSYVQKNSTGNFLPRGYKDKNLATKYANHLNSSH